MQNFTCMAFLAYFDLSISRLLSEFLCNHLASAFLPDSLFLLFHSLRETFFASVLKGLGECKMALMEYGDAILGDQSLREPIDRHKGDKHLGEMVMSRWLSLTCQGCFLRRLIQNPSDVVLCWFIRQIAVTSSQGSSLFDLSVCSVQIIISILVEHRLT